MYANPAIEPDMSNFYRLTREKIRAQKLSKDFPDIDRQYEMFYKKPLIAGFLQAVPTQNINRDTNPDSLIVSGRIPRGIEITNSIVTRKVLMRRFLMAALDTDPRARDDFAIAARDLEETCEHFGLSQFDQSQIQREARDFAADIKRRHSFRVV